MSLAMNLKQPEDIRPDEVVTHWELLREKVAHDVYRVYRSPNRSLKAWVLKGRDIVALIWDVNTGYEYQRNEKALYVLISKLGGWI